jgi:hypothetical protein
MRFPSTRTIFSRKRKRARETTVQSRRALKDSNALKIVPSYVGYIVQVHPVEEAMHLGHRVELTCWYFLGRVCSRRIRLAT